MTTVATMDFANKDQESLRRHGVPVDEVRRQWSLLMNGPRQIVLDRPATIGDGIERLDSSRHPSLTDTHRESTAQGRWMKFVPASGAASRMFALDTDDKKQAFCKSFARFAFADRAERQLSGRGVELSKLLQAGQHDALIEAIVSSAGLGYGQLSKGLVEFHSYSGVSRTPFEDHLLEALACFGAGDGAAKCHFTIAAEHREGFADRLRQFESQWPDTSVEVSFSVQHPSTDTIAVTDQGELLRGPNGEPVLRPGGHGALIENLNGMKGDLIFVKNIDNIAHEHARGASVAWTQILGGYLIRLQNVVHHHLRSLRTGDDDSIVAAVEFVQRVFPYETLPETGDVQTLRKVLTSRLRRPLRVCGMVRNEGEPGGGPFWVREADGAASLQIVEAAEVDEDDAVQRSVFQQATHFNPVFMALSVRDETGEQFDLRDFVDGERVIVTQKPLDGQAVTVLERPGLWNGAMARWNSVFLEVPIGVFSPVKTVLDLLRPEHQPPNRLQPA